MSSSFQHKPNRGSLFKNDDKQSEKHADYTGSADIGGNQYWLNAWIDETKDGKKYFSISIKPKEPRATEERKPLQTDEFTDPATFDDDIPF